MKTVLKKI